MKIIRSKTMKISILKPIFMTILACSLGFWGGSASAENLKVDLQLNLHLWIHIIRT